MSWTATVPCEDFEKFEFRCAHERLANVKNMPATISACGEGKYRIPTVCSGRTRRVASVRTACKI